MFSCLNASWLAANRNRWMMIVFLCYLGLVCAFGLIYYLIYQSDPNAFAFNADIIRTQSTAVELDSRRRLKQLVLEITQLNQLREELTTIDSAQIIGFKRRGISNTFTYFQRLECAIYLIRVWPQQDSFSRLENQCVVFDSKLVRQTVSNWDLC